MNKKELRIKVKNLLDEKSEYISNNHEKLSLNLVHLIQDIVSTKFNGCDLTIGGYSPIQKEPIWFRSFKGTEGNFSLVHMHEEIKLSFHPIEFEELVAKKEKLSLSEKLLEKKVSPDLILIPGLAFTRKLERLGRGKAYYDSFLKSYKGIKIGLFFDLQEVEDVYSENHDEKLDYIVTNKEIIRGI